MIETQRPGYDEIDPPIEDKSSNASQKFALELTDSVRAQLIPHGPDHPGGIKLGIRAGYRDRAENPEFETQYTWWIARDVDHVHVHGWPRGSEMVIGLRADHQANVATTHIQFKDLESIAFGSYIAYVKDLSGANVGVDIRFISAGDAALIDATVITPTARRQRGASCSALLAPFYADAFFQ